MESARTTKLVLAGEVEADKLIGENMFALLIGMVLDQQIPLDRAFKGPLLLSERLQVDLDPANILAVGSEALRTAFTEKPALHRFPVAMADRVMELASIVNTEYDNNASLILETAQDGKELLARITKLPGFGLQKAKIFIALCGKQLGLKCPGWQEVSLPFSEPGSLLSIADIRGPDSLAKVRENKKMMKEQAKLGQK
ncbi:MAG: Fe-S cluster assembly protein HesB [Firmicutes bacterium]|nr:Fe-S cluster assembly protein HesB [Bacillota bacterium]